jgi:hypothetical protein
MISRDSKSVLFLLNRLNEIFVRDMILWRTVAGEKYSDLKIQAPGSKL